MHAVDPDEGPVVTFARDGHAPIGVDEVQVAERSKYDVGPSPIDLVT